MRGFIVNNKSQSISLDRPSFSDDSQEEEILLSNNDRTLSIITLCNENHKIYKNGAYDIIVIGNIYESRTRKTEIADLIINALENHDYKLIDLVEGEYNILAFNRKNGVFHIINDRYGLKKLYYYSLKLILCNTDY